MAYERQSAIGDDGVVDYDCCLQSRARGYEADQLHVAVDLRADGLVDIHVDGCRHKRGHSVVGSSGSAEVVRVGGKEFIVVVVERGGFSDTVYNFIARTDEFLQSVWSKR